MSHLLILVIGELVLARATLGTQITQKAVDQIVVSCHTLTILRFATTEKAFPNRTAGISPV
jgi:hypothetical protein